MFLDINMSFLLLFVTLEVLSNLALTILLRIPLFLMQVDHDAFKSFKSLRDEKGVLTTVEVSEVPPSADIGSFIMNESSLETHIKDPPSIVSQSSSMDDSESIRLVSMFPQLSPRTYMILMLPGQYHRFPSCHLLKFTRKNLPTFRYLVGILMATRIRFTSIPRES
jgi:hypothetical protein